MQPPAAALVANRNPTVPRSWDSENTTVLTPPRSTSSGRCPKNRRTPTNTQPASSVQWLVEVEDGADDLVAEEGVGSDEAVGHDFEDAGIGEASALG